MVHLIQPCSRTLKVPKDNEEWGRTGAQADYLSKLRRLLAEMEPMIRKLAEHAWTASRKESRIAHTETEDQRIQHSDS
jgi:hypothetical protein